jgi:hypothetical protein
MTDYKRDEFEQHIIDTRPEFAAGLKMDPNILLARNRDQTYSNHRVQQNWETWQRAIDLQAGEKLEQQEPEAVKESPLDLLPPAMRWIPICDHYAESSIAQVRHEKGEDTISGGKGITRKVLFWVKVRIAPAESDPVQIMWAEKP